MKKTTIAASKKTSTDHSAAKTRKKTTTVKSDVSKKTVIKKETTTKKTSKSKTSYKPVKMNIQVQYNYHDVSLDDIEDMVVNHLVESGYKKTSILTLDIYYKAETSEVFYIAKTKNNETLKNEKPLYI